LFQNITIVNIWSDNGPKHFKLSANMKFLAILQHILKILIEFIIFFPFYYSCSICDAVISHTKKQISNLIINRNYNQNIGTNYNRS
jgi:hypothetical protein